MSVKYGDIKIIFRYSEGIDKPIVQPQFPLAFDLASDPGEKFNLMYEKLDMAWMFAPAFKALIAYKLSTVEYPNIEAGKDFSGYENVKGLVHKGEEKIAAWELHRHAG
jgi:hypothetical protein